MESEVKTEDECDSEVTSEMIEAGAIELARFNYDYESWEDGGARIYKAMRRHSSPGRSVSP